MQKFAVRMDGQKSDIFQILERDKEDQKAKLTDMDVYYKETLEEMTNNIERTNIMARESVQSKETELTNMIESQVGEMQVFVNTNIVDIIKERKATLNLYA